jgi:hypothetical protein
VKKILFVILLLILILVCFINIKQSSWMKVGEMQETVTLERPEKDTGVSEKQDYQTPEVYEINSLQLDSRLPELKLTPTEDTVYTFFNTISISVNLPKKISIADIFLINNGKKKDLFSQVSSGIYTFRNIFLDDEVNNLQFFYRVGNKRSISKKVVVFREHSGSYNETK